MYPHELSGGMRQRVMIAMAMAAKPSLMLADEPTSAVDVTTQTQILKLIRFLVDEGGISVLFISHDLAVIAQIADRVAVMYGGMIMEEGSVYEVFEKPLHPYTRALLASFPSEEAKGRDLEIIPGSVPNLMSIPVGCPFDPRCKCAREECKTRSPDLREVSPGHKAACVLY
jgi:oligopeptide/dipeptide ABC transporter ATP-binding protein